MDTLFLFTIGVVFVWSLAVSIISGTELVFNPVAVMVQAFLSILLLRLIFINKYAVIFAVSVLGIAIIFLVFGALTYVLGTPPADDMPRELPTLFEIGNFISMTIAYITGFEAYQPAFDNFIRWSLVFIFSVFVFAFSFLRFNFFVLMAVSVLTFGLALNSGFFFYNPAFYTFAFCILTYLIRHLNHRSMMQSSAKSSPFLLYALPFTGVCLAAAMLFPTPAVGTAQHFTDNFITRPFSAINRGIQDALHPRHFSLSQTGFGMSADRRLGGNVQANYDVVMRVNHPGPIYLTGNIFDSFTGYSWQSTFFDDEYVLDFSTTAQNIELIERSTSMFNIYGDNLIRFLEDVRVVSPGWAINLNEHLNMPLQHNEVTIEQIHRGFTIFTTGLVSGAIPPEDDMNILRNYSGGLQTSRLMQNGTRYTVFYATIDERIGIDDVRALEGSFTGVLQRAYDDVRRWENEGLSQNLLNVGPADANMPYTRVLSEYLIPRAAEIHEIYTRLPDHLPRRVADLAQIVAHQANATTTLEKAIALDSFLKDSGNFGYTLSPGDTPLDRDFVDHFLFDLEYGYCTHFASAFVVMARTLDIPARYVEGFIVTGTPDDDGYLDVINRMGHAWAEVYFEGFGWFRFDPTPPDGIYTISSENADTSSLSQPWDYDHSDAMRSIWDDVNLRELQGDFDIPGEIDFTAEVEQDFSINISELLVNSIIAAVLLAVTLFVLRVVYVGTRDAKITRISDNNEAIIAYFHRILRYMRLFRYEIESHETATDFGHRVGKRIGFESDTLYMADLAQIFSQACYSNKTATADDRKLLESAMHHLDRRLMGYMGMRRYFIYKYIKAVI